MRLVLVSLKGMMKHRIVIALSAVLAAAFFLLPSRAKAHEIPNDVLVQVYFKPQGAVGHLLVRVPLKAMRDIEFPTYGPGYLDLEHTAPMLPDGATLWISDFVDLYEGETLLPKPRIVATRLALESDRSFDSYENALANMQTKLPVNTQVAWDQPLMDVLLEYPIHSDRSAFSIRPAFWRLGLRVVTVLRSLHPNTDGTYFVRAFEFTTDPGLVHLDPRWYQAALQFVHLGFLHILDGTDHLLFLFCLVIPFRRFRALIPVVTAFTVAHSFTLIASAYNLAPDALWFPPLIETLIAVSIVYMALENIVGGSTVHKRWMIAFGFGLVHGFGFSFALRETLQFAGSHLLASLLSFNLGVELGQLFVLILMIPALELLFRYVVAERMGTIILSALVAHTAWHWMMDRWNVLSQFPFQWPAFTAAMLASAMRWLMMLMILAALVWVVASLLRQRAERSEEGKAAGAD
jgi:hypothetical protein